MFVNFNYIENVTNDYFLVTRFGMFYSFYFFLFSIISTICILMTDRENRF